jgi:ubiquinone/menaquinone biosynthesis C-methylase UbiE
VGEERFTDRDHLVRSAYPDSTNLESRRQIYRFQSPQISLPEWILRHLEGPVGNVLDVGCGPGFYLGALKERAQLLVGADLSPGMAAEARNATRLVAVADAQDLPFADDVFDTTMALHMLYHVADIDKAISELRRVTKGKGVVLVVTNGMDHMKGIRESFDRVMEKMSAHQVTPVLGGPRRFRLEDGAAMLARHFNSVIRDDMRAEIVVPETEPVVRYLMSITSYHEHKLPPDVSWESVTKAFIQEVEGLIDRDGAFKTPTHAGVFVCS